MSGAEFEWKRAPDFAEVAEALGIDTSMILGAMKNDGGTLTVVFTPAGTEMDDPVHVARLRRDADGIPRVLMRRDSGMTMRQFIPPDDVIERKLRERFGEPGTG